MSKQTVQMEFGNQDDQRNGGDRRVDVEFHSLEESGCWVAVHEGTLYYAPMLESGGFDPDEVGEVTAPENQEYLDEVNARFGTSFQTADFAGR